MSTGADLQQRLRALIGQSGGSPTTSSTPCADVADPILARLQRLRGRTRHCGDQAATAARDAEDDHALARHLGGEVHAPGVIKVERHIAPQGPLASAGCDGLADAVAHLLGDSRVRANPCFLDTETTGLAGGTGTVAFLVGLARWEHGELHVVQLMISAFHGEADMLSAVAESLGLRAAPAVTYNGRSFDGPLLSARSRLTHVADPLQDRIHLDLLPFTRRAFVRVYSDCRLATVERELLGVRRVDDLPGWAAPRAWLDWVRRRRPHDLRRVLAHNLRDLVSLAMLLPVLSSVYRGVPHPAADTLGVAGWMVRNHGHHAAREYLLRHRARLCPDGVAQLARLARRCGEWEEAAALWQELAATGSVEALENLAKYAEHHCKDLAQALTLTDTLIRLQGATAAHQQRLRRLRGKLERR